MAEKLNNVPDVRVPLPLNILGLGIPGMMQNIQNQRAEVLFATAEQARQTRRAEREDMLGRSATGLFPGTTEPFQAGGMTTPLPAASADAMRTFHAGLLSPQFAENLATRQIGPVTEHERELQRLELARAEADIRRLELAGDASLLQAEASRASILNQSRRWGMDLYKFDRGNVDTDLQRFMPEVDKLARQWWTISDALQRNQPIDIVGALYDVARIVDPEANIVTGQDIDAIQGGTGQGLLFLQQARAFGWKAGQQLDPTQQEALLNMVKGRVAQSARDAVQQIGAMQVDYHGTTMDAERILNRVRVAGLSIDELLELARLDQPDRVRR